jgi:hypothetical protein
MQIATRYMARRNYLTLALLLAVALAATSFGRWVIPSADSGSRTTVESTVNSAVPSWLRNHFANLKMSQLDIEDEMAGLGTSSVNTAAAPGARAQAERFAALKMAQLDIEDAMAGTSSVNTATAPGVRAQAERFAALKMAQLDEEDGTSGATQ